MDEISAIVLNMRDNVATALSDIAVGNHVLLRGERGDDVILASQHIPFGHKISLQEIYKGEDVIKYGEVIGRATKRIGLGEHVHIHNIESLRGRGDLADQSSQPL